MTRRQRRRPAPARAAAAAPDAAVLEARLRSGLAELGLDASPPLPGRLAAYLGLLARWNAAWNLTAVRDPLEMVPRHVLDSLAVAPWVRGPRVADVGTGAGLPGIPLALLLPADRFTLIDTAAKRTRFLRHVVTRLELDNVEVVEGRAEDYDAGAGFDTVVSRAFSALSDFVRLAGHLRRRDGHLLAMKGTLPDAELAALPAGWRVAAIGRLEVPGLAAERHAVLLSGPPEDGTG